MSDSIEKLTAVLENLGNEGISAYYTYLFLDYTTVWVVLGLCAWGVRTVWDKVKDDM